MNSEDLLSLLPTLPTEHRFTCTYRSIDRCEQYLLAPSTDGRGCDVQVLDLGHRTIVTKKTGRPADTASPRRKETKSRPISPALDETGSDGIGERVYDFRKNVLRSHQPDAAGGLRGPEVFPPTQMHIEHFCDELVEPGEEFWQSSKWIRNNHMIVIRHDLERMDNHSCALTRNRSAI